MAAFAEAHKLLEIKSRFLLRQILNKRIVPIVTSKITGSFNLCSAKCGMRLRIVAIQSDCAECLRLRELGFCETSVVCKVTEGSAIICSLYGTRLAIGRSLGERILVEPVAA